MENKLVNFIQHNSPDGGFLQSEYRRKFQEAWGRKTYNIFSRDNSGELLACANIITHTLPVVGDYFYVPRGPIIENFKFQISDFPAEAGSRHGGDKSNPNDKIQKFINDLFELARKENINWIRIEPNDEKVLKLIEENLPKGLKIKKAAVDMQPREILVLDITKSEDDLLAGMKQKTRYNIRLAEKRNVHITCNMKHVTQENMENFLRLVKITAERDKITVHPEGYYRKMFEAIPGDILKLYIAEYEGKIITANLVSFFGKTATYMHGASDNEHRNTMAPYLFQWQAICNAKRAGCTKYDLGGVKTVNSEQRSVINRSWEGITRFKLGFAPDTEPIQFPGCYDIILRPARYNLYRILQKIKRTF